VLALHLAESTDRKRYSKGATFVTLSWAHGASRSPRRKVGGQQVGAIDRRLFILGSNFSPCERGSVFWPWASPTSPGTKKGRLSPPLFYRIYCSTILIASAAPHSRCARRPEWPRASSDSRRRTDGRRCLRGCLRSCSRARETPRAPPRSVARDGAAK